MKNLLCPILLLCLPFLLSSETLDFVFSDFPPFEYVENDTAMGMNIEIIEEACRRLNVTPVFRQLPWKRALSYAETGRADAVFSLFRNEERLKIYIYPEENLNSVRMILITDRERDLTVTDLEDLAGMRVGVYLGSSYGEEFDRSDLFRKDDASSSEGLLRRQELGRTDVTVIDVHAAKYWIERLGLQDAFKALDFVVTEDPTFLAFSRVRAEQTGKDWAPDFTAVFREMKEDGFMDALDEKYSLFWES